MQWNQNIPRSSGRSGFAYLFKYFKLFAFCFLLFAYCSSLCGRPRCPQCNAVCRANTASRGNANTNAIRALRTLRLLLSQPPSRKPLSRNHASRRRLNTNCAAFGSEPSPVINRSPRFILPLMHHFVKQRVNRFRPSIPPHMPAREHDLAHATVVRARRVVAKPPRETARHLNIEMIKRTAKVLEIELRVQRRQACRHRQIVRVLRRLSSQCGTDWHRKLHDHIARRRAFRAIA